MGSAERITAVTGRRKKLACIVGTRPEAIKMAPVVLEARQRDWCEVILCASGQHCDLLSGALDAFDLTPNATLTVMRESQSLSELTANLLIAIDAYISDIRPDAVLVHGDTQTCLAAAQVCFWKRIPVGHVEAGLRTGTRDNPFPEEMNRILTDQLCDWLFAPTREARAHLLGAGASETAVIVTGNTVVDALLLASRELENRAAPYIDFDPNVLRDHDVILVTGHRRENHGENLSAMCMALKSVLEARPNSCAVFPVHLNPNVREMVYKQLASSPRAHLIPAQPYLAFVDLMRRSRVIVTDSGGIQEEAPSLGKMVLVTRPSTERPEMLRTGLVRIVGTQQSAIERAIHAALDRRDTTHHRSNPCGDGLASVRIMNYVERQLLHGLATQTSLNDDGGTSWSSPRVIGKP